MSITHSSSIMSQMIVNAVVNNDRDKLSLAIIEPYKLIREAVPGIRVPTTAGLAVASELRAGRSVAMPAIDVLPNDRRQWECR